MLIYIHRNIVKKFVLQVLFDKIYILYYKKALMHRYKITIKQIQAGTCSNLTCMLILVKMKLYKYSMFSDNNSK